MTPKRSTPTNKPIALITAEPLDKIKYATLAAALAPIALALLKHYVWADLPADLEGPLNTAIAAVVIGVATLAAGYFTKIKASEAKAINQAADEQQVAVAP